MSCARCSKVSRRRRPEPYRRRARRSRLTRMRGRPRSRRTPARSFPERSTPDESAESPKILDLKWEKPLRLSAAEPPAQATGKGDPMFSVLITEKGGEQRRYEFDKGEVTIGRVQGNDIVLPKGNVSKRHSRIVLKDGKF